MHHGIVAEMTLLRFFYMRMFFHQSKTKMKCVCMYNLIA